MLKLSARYELEPTNPEICNNVGVFLRRLGREEQALPWFDRAIEIRPNFIAARNNKSFALSQLHRFTDAIAIYDEVEAIDPSRAEADFNKSLVYLLTGNFELGWVGREARKNVPNPQITRFEFPQPRWLGKERIDGKTILLHTDEGLGDAIQFLRYAPMVAALGARVVVVVPDALCPLLSGLEGVSECIPLSETALPAFDLYCPLTSLPLAFGTRLRHYSIHDTVPVCSRRELAGLGGTAWGSRRVAGWPCLVRKSEASERLQSIHSLEHAGPHSGCRCQIFEFAKGSKARRQGVPPRPTRDCRPQRGAHRFCRDRRAHFMPGPGHYGRHQCCTSCGSAGLPDLILLPHTPDWRWLLDRDDSPWYPSARLFRQDETRDYTSVVARVRHELVKLVAGKKLL